MTTAIHQRVCLICHRDVVPLDYHSPMWQGDSLIPAAIRVSCECGETYAFIETMWRGEALHTYPPAGMSADAVLVAMININQRGSGYIPDEFVEAWE